MYWPLAFRILVGSNDMFLKRVSPDSKSKFVDTGYEADIYIYVYVYILIQLYIYRERESKINLEKSNVVIHPHPLAALKGPTQEATAV